MVTASALCQWVAANTSQLKGKISSRYAVHTGCRLAARRFLTSSTCAESGGRKCKQCAVLPTARRQQPGAVFLLLPTIKAMQGAAAALLLATSLFKAEQGAAASAPQASSTTTNPSDFILITLPLTPSISGEHCAPAWQGGAPGSSAGCISGCACNLQHCTPVLARH